MWTPDPQLELHLSRLVTRAFEQAREAELREERTADADFVRRGVFLSGMNVSARRDRAAATFKTAGEASIAEVLQALTEVLGPLSPDVIEWFRAHMKQRFASYAAARASALRQDRLRRQMKLTDHSDVDEAMNRIRSHLDRELEIVLVPMELKARLGALAHGYLPSKATGAREVDAFISHAGEDKADVARPLADGLIAAGFTVWIDQYELRVGDSVYGRIEDGLKRCRFGVVILSAHFFAKNWPRQELAALAALSDVEGRNKILPVWHGLSKADVAASAPLLVDIYAANTHAGINTVVQQISDSLRS